MSMAFHCPNVIATYVVSVVKVASHGTKLPNTRCREPEDESFSSDMCWTAKTLETEAEHRLKRRHWLPEDWRFDSYLCS